MWYHTSAVSTSSTVSRRACPTIPPCGSVLVTRAEEAEQEILQLFACHPSSVAMLILYCSVWRQLHGRARI
eukprot:359139-Chlamydomonas_euryale.AAC.26